MDLDDMLDDAANEHFTAPVKKVEAPAIKAFLAYTANVQPEVRDVWTSMVREDHANAKAMNNFQASNAYRVWDNSR